MKGHRATRQRLELRNCGGVAAGFAKVAAVQVRDLIGSDHQCRRSIGGNCTTLRFGETQGGRAGAFVGLRRFFDVRGYHLERYPEPFEQRPPSKT